MKKLSDSIFLWIILVLAAVIFAAVVGLVNNRAYAQDVRPKLFPAMCGDADELEKALRQNGERIAAFGPSTPGNSVVFWINDASGSWSVMVRSDDGGGCLLASGENGKIVQPKPPGRKA